MNKGKTVERVRSRNTARSAPGKWSWKNTVDIIKNVKTTTNRNTPQTIGITRVEWDRR